MRWQHGLRILLTCMLFWTAQAVDLLQGGNPEPFRTAYWGQQGASYSSAPVGISSYANVSITEPPGPAAIFLESGGKLTVETSWNREVGRSWLFCTNETHFVPHSELVNSPLASIDIHLPPGQYRCLVRTYTAAGEFTGGEASIGFVVIPAGGHGNRACEDPDVVPSSVLVALEHNKLGHHTTNETGLGLVAVARALRYAGKYTQAIACLGTIAERGVYHVGKNGVVSALSHIELIRSLRELGEQAEAASVEARLTAQLPGYTMSEELTGEHPAEQPKLTIVLDEVTKMPLRDIVHFICEYSGGDFMSYPRSSLAELPPALPYQNHFQLLRYISGKLPDDSVILDLGTRHGASAVALAADGRHRVLTFDLSQGQLYHNIKACSKSAEAWTSQLPNLVVQEGNILAQPDGIELLLSADLIMLDTNHAGDFEAEVYGLLHEADWKGILVCDDIYFNSPMDEFWGVVVQRPKFDLTAVAHSSGTGIVDFGAGVRVVQSATQ